MTRNAGACVLLGLLIGLLTAACGVGDEGGGGDDGGNPPDPIDPNPNRIQCSAAFTITGSFAPGTPARPVEVPTGCWPVGTWSFTATVDNTAEVLDITGDKKGDRCGEVAGTNAPALAPSYSFRVDRSPLNDDNGTPGDPSDDAIIGWSETYAYMGDMSTFLRIAVSERGGQACEGHLELISPDKKSHWELVPNQTGTTIDGIGDFTLFMDPQPY
jgi:hypothetical protein